MNELADIRAAVGEVEKRLSGNHSHAAIHISGGGAVAVIVGLVAVVCLIAASALAYVSWQQAQLTERQTTEMRSRLEMAEAKLILLEGRHGDTLDRPTDADLALLAADVDELKAKLITMRQRIEGAQS